MAEYIDREAVRNALYEADAITLEGVRILNEFPAAEVEEVRHGRWEDEYGGKYANPKYRCSNCKGSALCRFERDLLDNRKAVQALTDYCPHCGAKMDLEVNHEG